MDCYWGRKKFFIVVLHPKSWNLVNICCLFIIKTLTDGWLPTNRWIVVDWKTIILNSHLICGNLQLNLKKTPSNVNFMWISRETRIAFRTSSIFIDLSNYNVVMRIISIKTNCCCLDLLRGLRSRNWKIFISQR